MERVDRYKAALDAARPFQGDVLKELRDYYKIGLTWSSNAIEGNTLTITETKVVLEDGLTVGGHPLRELYETAGHGAAYDYMRSLTGNKSVTIEDIKTMHRLFYERIDSRNAGVWRDRPVFVTGSDYVFPSPEEIPAKMSELKNWAASERGRLHPVEFAALLHLKFVLIHPFVDGNGRTGRLLMNLVLLQDGYQIAMIPPVCRMEYLSAIRHYELRGDSKIFVEFIAGRVEESEKEIMRLLRIEDKGGKS